MKNRGNYALVLKLTTERLQRADWNLSVTLDEARMGDEAVSLSESQVLRWIDELNGVAAPTERIAALRRRIRAIQKLETAVKNRNEIRRLYAEIDALQYKPDYLLLVVEKVADYRKACKGFTVNGVKYARLVGTNGGVKAKTIVFVSERLAPELRRRIDNGRDMAAAHVPAKLEAYRALACSATTPVSMPRGILVVPDCETKFVEDIIEISDSDNGEPRLEYVDGATVKLNESDGYGLMCPALAARWSRELGLEYTSGGFNTRFSFEKGMVFTFDFHRFAEQAAGARKRETGASPDSCTLAPASSVTDLWGDQVDIAGVELILTASMLKLWSSYESCAHYLRRCAENGYSFGITKTCPEELESWRNTNYQFLQSYELSDGDIRELAQPTVDRIRDVVGGDWRKAALFLGAKHMSGYTRSDSNTGLLPILMDHRMHDDPFVRSKLLQLIHGEIDDAKIGVLGVHGNYSVVSGDPYALCQSVFGLPVTGLLRAGEVYNQYWADRGVERTAVFRAPMTCHNNIRVARVADRPEARDWYAHLRTCTVINAWDSMAHALNGMDKDGDMVFMTDNPVLLRRARPARTILCAQRVAGKTVPKEKDLVRSNINGFGDDIGKITNYITSMFDVQSRFAPGSEEYETLGYRIMCGQHFQQAAIDKIKGIVSKPMPKHWYDYRSAVEADGGAPGLNVRIVANKKPYFMRYIYPDLAKRVGKFEKNAWSKFVREFREDPGELFFAHTEGEDRRKQFCDIYRTYYPVSNSGCVTNRVCRFVERAFSDKVALIHGGEFDLSVFRSSKGYSRTHYKAIASLQKDYMAFLRAELIAAKHKNKRVADNHIYDRKMVVAARFRAMLYGICSNKDAVLDILIDLCYSNDKSKQFLWDVAQEVLRERMIESGCRRIAKFSACGADEADVAWCGTCYRITYEEAQGYEDDYPE